MASATAERTPVGLQSDGQIISRCGLVCNTCTAFMTGACPGCHRLQTGECVLRDCAELRGTSCLDCDAPSCYHFEAYRIRRQLMNAKAKRFYRLLNPNGVSRTGACGSCSTRSGNGSPCAGGCGSGGCGPGSCPAARMIEKLAAL